MPDKIEAFIILLFLLPGFVGLIVYEIVAEVPRREIFDKVVVALALTVVATVIHGFFASTIGAPAGLEQLVSISAAKTDAQGAQNLASGRAIIAGLGWTTAIAAVLGLVFAVIQNKGLVYKTLLRLRATRRTGAIDVWHQVFSRGARCWVRLRFKNGAMLVGWAKYFSEDSKTMALFVSEATWHMPTLQPAPATGATPATQGCAPAASAATGSSSTAASAIDFTKIAPGDIDRYVAVDVKGPGVLITKFDEVVAIDQLD